MMRWQQHLINILKKNDIIIDVSLFGVPPEIAKGHVAIPAFIIAKQKGKNPVQVALEMTKLFIPDELVIHAQAEGPYCNITLTAQALEEVLDVIEDKKEKFGNRAESQKTIMLEYSQPNTHKSFHIGHARNVMLGNALANIWESQGNTVIRTTYVNDVGSHVAKCLWAFMMLHDGVAPQTDKGTWLGRIYEEGEAALKENEEAQEEMRAILKNLEEGKEDVVAIWNETRQWSLDSFKKIYETTGTQFKQWYFESDVRQQGQGLVDELLERGIAQKSDGAVIMNLEKEHLDVLVIRKSDGVGLYATSDLGLALEKMKTTWDESVVLTDVRQGLYFKQLHKTLELYGVERKFSHIGYEFVTLKSGSMSSRKGNVILFEDFWSEVVDEAMTQTKKRHEDWDDELVKDIAQKITKAAIVFSMLKTAPSQVITFDKDDALSFEGFTGPYVLYTYARIMRLLEKLPLNQIEGELTHHLEHTLLMQLHQTPDALYKAAHDQNPATACKFVYDLCQSFSSYYGQVQIIEGDVIPKNRVRLLKGIAQTIKNVLTILNIEVVEKM